MLVILHLAPDPFSALPVLYLGKLFSMYLPDSFLLWLLVGLVNENQEQKTGGYEGREDGVLTPSDSHRVSIISMEPASIGSALVWLSYFLVQAQNETGFPPLLIPGALHSLYYPPPRSYLINWPFTNTPFHSTLWWYHLFPTGTWLIRYEHSKFGYKSGWTEKKQKEVERKRVHFKWV